MNNFRSKINKIAAALLSMALLLAVPVTLHAGGAGTPEDPLITYSYLINVFRGELKNELYAELYAVLKQDLLDAAANGQLTLPQQPSAPTPQPTAESGYEVVHLKQGQTLLADEVCEIILRSGQAAAVVQSPENVKAGVGLSDVTAGSEVTNGQSIQRNHLLLVARADGRGILVTSGEAYLMVRGAYVIV